MLVKQAKSHTHISEKGDISFAIGQYPLTIRQIDTSAKAARFFSEIWNRRLLTEQEEMYAIYVNHQLELVDYRMLHRGSRSRCPFDAKVILKYAILSNAYGVFIAHNHPEGTLEPSKMDKDATAKIKASCDLLDITLLDHIILTNKCYYSFAEKGTL